MAATKKNPDPKEKPKGYVAGLYLHEGPRGKAYYYHFKFNGEGYRGSTGTDSPKEAKAFLDELKTELRQKKRRQQSTRLSLPILCKVYEEWVVEMTPKASAAHLNSVDSYWRRHIEPFLGDLHLDKVSTSAVEKCRAIYLDGGGTPGGANSLLIALNALMGWAIRHRHIAAKPYSVKKLRVQRVPRPVLPPNLVPKFLQVVDKAESSHVKAAIRMMIGLGLREDEALSARWEWLDIHRATYTAGKTKGREAVALDVPEWLMSYFKRLRPKSGEGLMFPAEDGEPHRAGFTRKSVARASKVVKIKLTPHRLRASFATLHSDLGTSTPEVQRMLRHKNIQTTMRYIESGRQGLEEAQRKVAEAMGLQKAKKVTQPIGTQKRINKGDKDGDKINVKPRRS